MKLADLALRNVARNRRRSALVIAAVASGVAAVVVLRGFVGGFLSYMVDSVVKGRTGALQVHRAGYVDSMEAVPVGLSLPYAPALLDRVRAVPGVAAVSGRIMLSGLVGNGIRQAMFVGRGLDVAREAEVCPLTTFDLEEGGRPLSPSDRAVALLGGDLARSLGVRAARAGDAAGGPPRAGESGVDAVTISSTSPEGRANSLDVTVVGTTASGFAFENKRVLTVPLGLAQELVGVDGQVTELAIAVHDLERLDEVASALRAALGPAFEVHTWQDLQPFFRDIVIRQKFVLNLVALILFAIVVTGVANAVSMNVFERVREIGTMMAVGVRRRQVLGLFLLEAAMLGILGGVAGGVLGSAIVAYLHQLGIPMAVAGTSRLSVIRPDVTVAYVVGAVWAAGIGAIASAVWPALRAARLRPVEALRSN